MGDEILTIFIVEDEGYFTLVDQNGEYPEERYGYKTEEEAFEACTKLWPENSIWKGRRSWTVEL